MCDTIARMKITKLGHCCLIVEEKGVRFMTDPGAYSTLQDEARNIDFIFITHEHPDHLHIESLKTVLKNNPKANIVSNNSVGKILEKEGIPYQLLEHGAIGEFSGICVEGFGEQHAVIYQEFGQVQNTGYFFQNRLFYPGDAFYNPHRPVEILALPVGGPWLKISDAIEYALTLKPKVCFPVHDGMLRFNQVTRLIPQTFLPPAGIEFRDAGEGTELSF